MAQSRWTQQADVAEIYDRLGPTLYGYALMLLADHHEAEDAIQTVFTTLIRRGTNGVDDVDRYLRASVRNECYSLLGRRRSNGHTNATTPLLEVVGDGQAADDRLAIEEGLRALPAEQREIVHLKVFEGYSFQEIADLAGESINTVASRYRYGIDKLKQTFGVRSRR